MGDYWSANSVLKRQTKHPVVLTNGCCESTLEGDNGDKVMRKLNLPFSGWDGSQTPSSIDIPVGGKLTGDYEFYPLNGDENKVIAEDAIDGPYGGMFFGYTSLYKGQKYASPCVEICFDSDKRPFSRRSYGDALYATEAEAKAEADRLAAYLGRKFKRVGGFTYVSEPEHDRFSVYVLIPIASAMRMVKKLGWDGYKQRLGDILNGYQPTPYTGGIPDPDVEVVYGRRLTLAPHGYNMGQDHIVPSPHTTSDKHPPTFYCTTHYLRNVLNRLFSQYRDSIGELGMYLTVKTVHGDILEGVRVQAWRALEPDDGEEVIFRKDGNPIIVRAFDVVRIDLGF